MPRPVEIAITGLGAVTPYGVGWEALLDGLTRGENAITPLSVFENPLAVHPVVGQVTQPLNVDSDTGLYLSRTDRLAILAARQAVAMAAIGADDRAACPVVLGSTVAGLTDLVPEVVHDPAAYYRRTGTRPASSYPVGHVAACVAADLGCGGPRIGVNVACSSGALALAAAANMIAEGRATVALAGGSDALCAVTLAGFASLQALDSQPCRPFSRSRSGLNVGEGAAAVVLEEWTHARARGAVILGRLAGWASSNDALHPTAPDDQGRGLARAMRLSLEMAGVAPAAIGYVNAHGTGTPLNDVAEMRGYERVFAGRPGPVPVSSTKSYIGHTLGAAGAIEAVITLLGLRHGLLFPTLRLAEPEESPLVEFLAGAPRPTSMRAAMSVSAGFGGTNASLVFTRADAEDES